MENRVQRVLVGSQPHGEIRVALTDDQDEAEIIARFKRSMSPEKAAVTTWAVQQRALR